MTIKIKGFNFVPVSPGRKGGAYTQFAKDEVIFATDDAGRQSPGQYAVRIGVPVSIMKQARINPGETVIVAFDAEHRCGLIQFSRYSGYKVSKGNGNRNYVKFNLKPGVPTVAESCGCRCEVTEDGIIFMLPDCVSFDRNLRAEADAKN